MAPAHVRHLLAVPATKIGVALFLFWGLGAQGQLNTRSYHARGVDASVLSFGFTIGMNLADVRAEFATFPLVVPADALGRSLVNIAVASQPGLNLGLVATAKLGDRLDLRVAPQVSLQQRNFTFEFDNGDASVRKLESSYLQVPILLKYKSAVYRDYRVFVALGPVISLNLASDEDVANDPELLKIEKTDFSWQFSFGFDIYGDKVKLTPELFYQIGTRDVYVPLNEEVPGAIRSVYTQTVGIQLTFGG
ncbi:MAG: porin family protein [Bacteroidia bacterium]|nr:porin family protein [Bacteroidia bacterium]